MNNSKENCKPAPKVLDEGVADHLGITQKRIVSYALCINEIHRRRHE